MTPQELIDRIAKAHYLGEVLDLADWKKQYLKAVRMIHPDICTLPGAEAALKRLFELKDQWDKGYQLDDDAGSVSAQDKAVTFVGDPELLLKSYQNYNYLKRSNTPAGQHFSRYLPESMTLVGERMSMALKDRAVPLSGLTLPQGHANWILSRLLEFSAWLAQEGWTHCGINPESVFVVPKTHGIIITSFYHLTPREGKVKTISAKYKHWYPDALFVEKRASPFIDTELCKRTIAVLLGDPSGMGVKLKKTHNAKFVDFLLTPHADPFVCYHQYRLLLKQHFPKEFLPLNL